MEVHKYDVLLLSFEDEHNNLINKTHTENVKNGILTRNCPKYPNDPSSPVPHSREKKPAKIL
jgi:hypothetical protein